MGKSKNNKKNNNNSQGDKPLATVSVNAPNEVIDTATGQVVQAFHLNGEPAIVSGPAVAKPVVPSVVAAVPAATKAPSPKAPAPAAPKPAGAPAGKAPNSGNSQPKVTGNSPSSSPAQTNSEQAVDLKPKTQAVSFAEVLACYKPVLHKSYEAWAKSHNFDARYSESNETAHGEEHFLRELAECKALARCCGYARSNDSKVLYLIDYQGSARLAALVNRLKSKCSEIMQKPVSIIAKTIPVVSVVRDAFAAARDILNIATTVEKPANSITVLWCVDLYHLDEVDFLNLIGKYEASAACVVKHDFLESFGHFAETSWRVIDGNVHQKHHGSGKTYLAPHPTFDWLFGDGSVKVAEDKYLIHHSFQSVGDMGIYFLSVSDSPVPQATHHEPTFFQHHISASFFRQLWQSEGQWVCASLSYWEQLNCLIFGRDCVIDRRIVELAATATGPHSHQWALEAFVVQVKNDAQVKYPCYTKCIPEFAGILTNSIMYAWSNYQAEYVHACMTIDHGVISRGVGLRKPGFQVTRPAAAIVPSPPTSATPLAAVPIAAAFAESKPLLHRIAAPLGALVIAGMSNEFFKKIIGSHRVVNTFVAPVIEETVAACGPDWNFALWAAYEQVPRCVGWMISPLPLSVRVSLCVWEMSMKLGITYAITKLRKRNRWAALGVHFAWNALNSYVVDVNQMGTDQIMNTIGVYAYSNYDQPLEFAHAGGATLTNDVAYTVRQAQQSWSSTPSGDAVNRWVSTHVKGEWAAGNKFWRFLCQIWEWLRTRLSIKQAGSPVDTCARLWLEKRGLIGPHGTASGCATLEAWPAYLWANALRTVPLFGDQPTLEAGLLDENGVYPIPSDSSFSRQNFVADDGGIVKPYNHTNKCGKFWLKSSTKNSCGDIQVFLAFDLPMYSSANTVECSRAMAQSRLMAETPQLLDPSVDEEWEYLWMWFGDRLATALVGWGVVDRDEVMEYVLNLKPAFKRVRGLIAFQDWDEGKPLRASIEVLIKLDEVLLKWRPRPIYNLDPMINIIFGHLFQRLHEHLAHLWNVKGHVVGNVCLTFAGGMTDQQLSEWFAIVPKMNQIRVIVLGDDAAVKGVDRFGRAFSACFDFSKYDCSQGKGVVMGLAHWYESMGLTKSLANLYISLWSRTLVGNGWRISKNAVRRPTGIFDTCLGNSVVTGLSYMGMDLSATTFCSDYIAKAARLGLKVTGGATNIHTINFLKGKWWPSDEGDWVWAPLPSRIWKSGKSTSVLKGFTKNATSAWHERLRGWYFQMITFALPPLLLEWVAMLSSLGEGHVGFEETTAPWKVAGTLGHKRINYEEAMRSLSEYYRLGIDEIEEAINLIPSTLPKDSGLMFVHPVFRRIIVNDYA